MNGDEPPRKKSDPALALAHLRQAQRELEDDVETSVACPECQFCPGCGGTHLVTPSRRVELLKGQAGRSGTRKKVEP